MKVSNNKIGSTAPAKSTKAEVSTLKKDPKGSAGVGAREGLTGANVSVSERAQMMGKARDLASQPTEVDEGKVARLQKMIDEGSYKMDADKIADKLVDEHMLIPD